MSGILITGTSGFIGRALAESMGSDHEVFCISRQKTEVAGVTAIQGDFTSPDDLRKIDPNRVDVVVHLAAVTGGGTEEELLRVNVMGTYQLVRHFIDGGCKKFVLASSIAAVGMQSPLFQTVTVTDARRTPVSGSGGIRLLEVYDGGGLTLSRTSERGSGFHQYPLSKYRPGRP